MSELTGIVCLNVHHVLPKTYEHYSFVKRDDPVLRIMVSRSTSHWDCIMKMESEFQDWLSGLSLAYGMQTVPIREKSVLTTTEEEMIDSEDEDGMRMM